MFSTKQSPGKAMLLCVVLFSANEIARGQSTVFNMPSTDVIPAERFYVETDFITHLSSYEQGGYQLYGSRVVYGLRNNVEIGMNVYYTRSSDSPEPIVVEPNLKWQFYNNEEKGLSAVAGALVSIPVSHRSSGNSSAFMYAVGSKKFKGDFGPRISAGAYFLAVHAEPGTSKQGVLVGYEQPLNARLSFVADWTSGTNDLGYAAAGIGITLTPKSALYVGYNVGNQGRGNNTLGIYYGFTF